MSLFGRLYRRNRILGMSMLACLCFLALAVYGWGVTWRDMFTYLWVSVVLLALVVGSAAGVGWLIYRLKRWLAGRE